MKVRSQDWWERVVMMEFTDADWHDNFRMSRRSFTKLCQMMERVMEPCEVTVRTPVPLGMRVAIVLYEPRYLAIPVLSTVYKRHDIHVFNHTC